MTERTFADDAWEQITPILDAIKAHPFITALGDGSLDRGKFLYYMAQDARYLREYSRSLAWAASQAHDSADALFWANSSMRANSVESSLHGSYLGGDPELINIEPSPTCTAYTSWQAKQGASGSYARLVASLLPCFLIYEHVGNHLLSVTGDLSGHPYEAWISMYGGADFAEGCAGARHILGTAAHNLPQDQLELVMRSYVVSARYEWMFWDAAWRQEDWPI